MEEEDEGENKGGEGEEAVEEPRGVPLFGHEVVEVSAVDEVSHLRCLRCGAEVRVTEASKLRGAPCSGSNSPCARCGAPAAYDSYAGPLCNGCSEAFESYSTTARPILVLRRGASLKGRHPLDGNPNVRVAWVGDLKTFFIKQDEAWRCPYCPDRFKTLAEATKHTIDKHPGASRWGKVYVSGVGDVVSSGQGLFCPVCGLMAEGEERLREHHRTHESLDEANGGE